MRARVRPASRTPRWRRSSGPTASRSFARRWYDTESIAQDGGTLYVGIERVNRIVRLDYGKDGLSARAQPIEVPPGVRTLPNNKGLEALVFVPRNLPLGGTLIAISERGLDKAGNILGFLIGGPRPGTFTIKRRPISTSAMPRCCRPATSSCSNASSAGRAASSSASAASRLRSVRPGALLDGPRPVRGRSRL